MKNQFEDKIYVKVSTCSREDEMDFQERDIWGIIEDLKLGIKTVHMLSIRIPANGDNNGEILEAIENKAKELSGDENSVVLFRAFLYKDDFKNEPTDEEYDSELTRLDSLLTKNTKFVNINRFHGFEYSLGYIYNSSPAEKIIAYCLNDANC